MQIKARKLCKPVVYCLVIWALGLFAFYRFQYEEREQVGTSDVTTASVEEDYTESVFESEEEEVTLWATFDPNEIGFEKDIFMVESSGSLGLTARQGCVVEAAAAAHPYRNIWVLFTGGNLTTINVFESSVTVSLLFYRNVKLRHLPVSKTFKSTKLWRWFVFSDWQNS